MNNLKENRLLHDIEVIKRIILDILPAVETILLCGGYGRNEGAWIFENEIMKPYNDYDFAVISSKKYDRKLINTVRKKCAKEVDINWVDIDVYSINDLKKLKSKIKNFDLINGSKVVYGDFNIYDKCKKIKSENIGFLDIEILYYTRIWTFFGALPTTLFEKDFTKDESVFFKNQMAKAVLAIVDAVLVDMKLYVSSYHERVKRFCELGNCRYNDIAIKNLAKWALEEKLAPTQEAIHRNEAKELYNTVYELYYQNLAIRVGNHYGCKDLMDLHEKKDNVILSKMKKAYHKLSHTYVAYDKAINMKYAQHFLFLAYNLGDYSSDAMKMVNLYMKDVIEYNETYEWNSARVQIAKLRIEM